MKPNSLEDRDRQRAWVSSRFSWNDIATRTLEVYKSVLRWGWAIPDARVEGWVGKGLLRSTVILGAFSSRAAEMSCGTILNS